MASAPTDRYKLVFFAPPLDLPPIKEAIFATGAGHYPGPGNYTKCAFTTPGIGQFLPGDSAKPHIGQPGKVEEVGEVRCEIICVGREVAREAVAALKKAHPYETAAYEVYKVEDL
ncbi:GTP cyclohydrolase 1 type 2/Nif3 [Neohortaea acidophila]|uniref:ATP phosphoribosyltransferase n=1 Tax=Neohortaea acidophila TaxID=245834 RepID=A0A6A6PNV2_9PEZI|nr:GTP cyclohydrolase 1 type 2/Nif3 [Neohortaea acidophila]KAF2481476.1 GTP cyclohydrolase 1 type 2/Nif3 [Neohortaea acidophila]